jgi:hypothetical protein
MVAYWAAAKAVEMDNVLQYLYLASSFVAAGFDCIVHVMHPTLFYSYVEYTVRYITKRT